MNGSQTRPPVRALYARWPVGARRTGGFAAPLVVLASYLLAALPAGLVSIVMALMAADSLEGMAGAAMRPEIILPAMLVQFGVWGGLTVLWVKLFERRGMDTLGLHGAGRWLSRLGAGLAAGVGLGLGLTLVAGLVGTVFPGAAPIEDMPAIADFDAARILAPAALGLLAAIAGVFLIQGAVEEVIFRGWLMSLLTARWGVVAAVAVSSLIFMVFHAHVFASGVLYGALALSGIGATGLFFALYALHQRSIIAPMAAHGAFNVCVLSLPLGVRIAAEPGADPGAVFAQVMTSATGQAGADAITLGPQHAVQLIVFCILSLTMIALLRARAKG